MPTIVTTDQIDRTDTVEATRPRLRAVFQRGPESLTLHWVAERERRDGEIQIIVGDLIPGPVEAEFAETQAAAD